MSQIIDQCTGSIITQGWIVCRYGLRPPRSIDFQSPGPATRYSRPKCAPSANSPHTNSDHSRPVARKNREAQIVTNLQQNTPTVIFHDDALFPRRVAFMFSRKRKEMTLIIAGITTVWFHKIEAIVIANRPPGSPHYLPPPPVGRKPPEASTSGYRYRPVRPLPRDRYKSQS